MRAKLGETDAVASLDARVARSLTEVGALPDADVLVNSARVARSVLPKDGKELMSGEPIQESVNDVPSSSGVGLSDADVAARDAAIIAKSHPAGMEARNLGPLVVDSTPEP